MSLRKFIRRGIGLLGFLWFVSVYAYPIPDSIAVRLQGFVSTFRIQSAYSVEQDVVCGITESWR